MWVLVVMVGRSERSGRQTSTLHPHLEALRVDRGGLTLVEGLPLNSLIPPLLQHHSCLPSHPRGP